MDSALSCEVSCSDKVKYTNELCRSTQNNNADDLTQTCGCKGVRSCRLCEDSGKRLLEVDLDPKEDENPEVYNFCLCCQKPWLKVVNSTANVVPIQAHVQTSDRDAGAMEREVSEGKTARANQALISTDCDHHSQASVDFNGVLVIEDFVTEEEELALCKAVYQTDFVNSQSGRRKQDYGPKVNFKKKKLKSGSFTGLPSYSRFLFERMKQQDGLTDFEPVELCNLEYCSERGAHIDPHFDDAWLWGERLITLNLLSDSALTFTSDAYPGVMVRVPLLQRSLVVVQAQARHLWKHGICRGDVSEKRVAMTFRELSAEFKLGGDREEDGEELLKLALTFQGCTVGVS